MDETRIYRLNAAVDGWIRETFNNSTGMVVKKDEPLASFYSPEFLTAQQSLIYALGTLDQYKAAADQEPPTQLYFNKRNLKQAEDTLRNLGMSEVTDQGNRKHPGVCGEYHASGPRPPASSLPGMSLPARGSRRALNGTAWLT